MNFIIIAKVRMFDNSWQLTIYLKKMILLKGIMEPLYKYRKKRVEGQITSKIILGRSYYICNVPVE